MPDELLTAADLAARLRVQPDTIREWSRKGRIPSVKITPKVVRFDFEAVLSVFKVECSETEVPREEK